MSRFILRLKICLKDRTAGICYLISSIVVLALLLGLDSAGEERSSIPVGLVMYDESEEAQNFANGMKNTPSVYVKEGELEDLREELLDGLIECVFIVDEGFGEKIRMGLPDETIRVISGEDDRVSVILSDITAGNMIYDICFNKAYRAYKALNGEVQMSRSEYADVVAALKDDSDFAFTFNLTYEDSSTKKIEEKEITNGMIYKQMIAGMLAMLLSLIAFVSCNCFCLEYESGVAYRLKELPGKRLPSETMDFFGVFVYTLPLGLAAGFLISGVDGLLYSVAYLFFMCMLCTFVSKLIKKTESYQIAGAVIVIGLGVLGFVSVFSGLIGGPEFLKYTPNAIYIDMLL